MNETNAIIRKLCDSLFVSGRRVIRTLHANTDWRIDFNISMDQQLIINY